MNFLAHIYLSGDNDMVKIGNFSADGIHGKKYLNYPPEFQKGVLLHRNIDSFTDSHPVFKSSTKRLHENYGHYSGVIIDIFYDHFLASNWERYSEVPLETYVDEFYKLLQENYEILPKRIQKMMPHMIRDNWLVTYGNIEGIRRVLAQMNHRTANKSKMHLAVIELELYYEDFKNEFISFFGEIIEYAESKLKTL